MAAVTLTGDMAEPAAKDMSATFRWVGHEIGLQTSLAGLEADWRALEAGGTVPMFQGWDYIAKWVAIAAQASGEMLVFVVGRRHGAVAFILPMAVTRRAGVKLLTWLGQSHSNYGMGLFGDGVPEAAQGREIDHLMIEVARRAGAAIVHLDRQPARWAGRANPFACGRAVRTANDTFVLALDDDFAAQYRRLFSGRTVSGLKRKQRRLEEQHGANFAQPSTAAARQDLLDWFFAEKSNQLAESGRSSPFDPPHIRAFYRALAEDDRTFILDELSADGSFIAMAMSARHGRTEYLLNTVHAGGEHARYSPGQLLLHRIVAQAHAAGARVYDFGPGEFAYKLDWEPEVVPLCASTWLVNPLALPHYLALTLGVAAKARIKRSDRLRDLAGWLRARLSRR